ncbi:DNA cytosine methyltransferase [Streptomyces sp. NPDC006703]|uniref:DNA cytosine methyltransferase n=1 Tax=Streptomyces sp. NPDC006703 TaxID=3364759 RepID=UPI0036B4B128
MPELEQGPAKDRTAVELFAGGGGLAMAVTRAGFRPLLFNEFAKRACETLVANRAELVPEGEEPWIPEPGQKPPLVAGDVQTLDMSYFRQNGVEVDILAGGPPCQPFSLGGIAKGDEDKRNMFPQMFKAIRQIQPKAVICENVRGLLRPSFKPYFEYIIREMELPFVERQENVSWSQHDEELKRRMTDESIPPEQRYKVRYLEVNAANYGVPQIRRRVIIVAFRSDLKKVDIDAFVASMKEGDYSEDALIRSMLGDGENEGEYWQRHPDVPNHVKERVLKRLPMTPPLDDGKKPWRTLRDAIAGVCADGKALPEITDDLLDRTEHNLGGFTDHIGWPDARIYDGHTPNELDRPAKTVKAGVHGVPGGESVMELDKRVRDKTSPDGWRYKHRYMTVRETARVMTFPDDWVLKGPRGEQMRQLGNAVPVLLGEVFAKAVATALDKAESEA